MKKIIYLLLLISFAAADEVLAYTPKRGHILVNKIDYDIGYGHDSALVSARWIQPKGRRNGYSDYRGAVYIPSQITYKGRSYKVFWIEGSAFQNSDKLTEVHLPNSVSLIGNYAFLHCKNLRTIEMSDSIRIIGDCAFKGCENLKSITLPTTLTYIGKGAFRGSGIRSIEIPVGVQTIHRATFLDCQNLKTIKIPGSVTRIDSIAFADCTRLDSIVIGAGVQEIAENAFSGCKNLTKVYYPNGLDLSKVSIPKSAQLIAYDTKVVPFSAYAKPIVEKAINNWQIKGEYEKLSDYQHRVNENTRNKKISELTQQCEEEYLRRYNDLLGISLKLEHPYDSENEVFLLTEAQLGDILVPVPIDEAAEFKKNWFTDEYIGPIVTPKFFIENDVLALASLDIYFPSLNKHYTDSNQSSLKYVQAQVDYNFDPIEIAAGGGSVLKGQQTIEQKKIAIGKSQVDINIPQTNASNPNTFVIIIANEDYKSVAPVPFALNDGLTFAKYCQRTLGIPAANIKVHENATYNDIRLAMAWLKNVCEKYEGEASVIFYYAGHGIPDVSDKSAYLLPVDGDGRYVSTGYKLDDLYQKLGGMPTKSTIVLLDACFSGSNRDGKMLASERGVALKVKAGVPQGNMVVFSAAQSDETALPNEDEGHGMFTYYILKKLQETNGDVTLQDLSQYVIREVGRKSAVTNKAQTPTVTPSSAVGTEWQNWKLK